MKYGEFEQWLKEAVLSYGGDDKINDVNSFEDEGVLTGNVGLVVKLVDGSQFQVTIVKSRESQDESNKI